MTQHASDCAVHNAPAKEPGPCDCGAEPQFTNADMPQGPFDYETTAPVGGHHGKGHVYIIDGTGRKIMSVWGPAGTKMALCDAILSTLNQHSE